MPALGVVERGDQRVRDGGRFDRPDARRNQRHQRPEHARRQDLAAPRRLAERRAIADQERGLRDHQRLVAQRGDGFLHLALDAVVEDARAAIGAERGDDGKTARAGRARGAGDRDDEVEIDGAKALSEPATLIVVPSAM